MVEINELSFLVPRFERAKGGEKGDFPLLHSILIMPFVFIPIPSATYPHIQTPHRPQPPEHHHLSPSSPQVQTPPVRSRGKNLKGDLKRPTKAPSGTRDREREREVGEEKQKESGMRALPSLHLRSCLFSMGYNLYKLSNLHTVGTKIGGREGDRIHNCEAREKDRNRRVQGGRGHGSLSIHIIEKIREISS